MLQRGRALLETLSATLRQKLGEIDKAIGETERSVENLVTELTQALLNAETGLEKEFAKLPAVAGKDGKEIGRAYQRLLREIEQVRPSQTRLKTVDALVSELEQGRRNLLGEISDIRSARTAAKQKAVKSLNKRLAGKLRISIVPDGLHQPLREFLQGLPGVGEKKTEWADEAQDLTVMGLVAAIREGKDALLGKQWGLTSGVAETLTRMTAAQVYGLEAIDLEDRVGLELNVSHTGDQYRGLDRLSTGQQCTAILHLLLLDNPDPLVMDQPEDNLDNAFIAERIRAGAARSQDRTPVPVRNPQREYPGFRRRGVDRRVLCIGRSRRNAGRCARLHRHAGDSRSGGKHSGRWQGGFHATQREIWVRLLMTKSELLELIANGENSGVEFKRDDLRPEQLAKEVVALANFQGGRILLGVDDDGTFTGIQRADLERWVMDTVFGRYVHPMIIPFYEEVQADEQHRVAVITVSQGVPKPYVVRSKDREDIYIRVGSTSRLATREQQARLYALGGMLHAELLPVSGSGLQDLSLDRLKDYLSTVVGDKTLPANDEDWRKRLCGLGFMVERIDGPAVCTIAGLIPFGHAPRRLIRQAGVRWLAFEGEDKSYRALDDRVIDGALVALWKTDEKGNRELVEGGLIEKLVDSMQPFVAEESDDVDASMRRERRWLYPVEALREAIVNALAHRDWTRYEEIEIARYADRLEVLSPGALQNSMTVEKMIAGQRSTRNPLIVEVLRDYGYVDARGMGVRNKIIPLLMEHNGTEPEFIATEDHLRLVLRSSPVRSETYG